VKDDEIIQMGDAVLNDLNAVSAQLQNNILEAYNVEMVRMFARLHATDPTTGAFNSTVYTDYIRDYGKQNDYNRYTFKTKKEADDFANELAKHSSNHVVVSPIALNGKYYVETKGAVEIDDATGKTHKFNSADSIVETYINATGNQAKVYSNSDNYTSAVENKQVGTVEVGMITSAIEAEQDEDLRKAYRKIKRLQAEISDLAERYDSESILHSNTKRDAMGKEVFDERTGTGVKNRGGNAVEHEATVINNRMVIIDGKLVTDTKKVAEVTQRHNERMKTVDDAHVKIDKKNKKLGVTDRREHRFLFSREQIKMQINAEGVRDRRIRQNYYSHTTYSSRDSSLVDSFRNSLGKEQLVMSNLSTDILIDKSTIEAIDRYRNSADYGKRKFTDSQFAKFSKREQETLDNLLKISATQPSTFLASLSAEDRINLNSMAKKTADCGDAYASHGVTSAPISTTDTTDLRTIQGHTDIKTGIDDISQAFSYGSLGTYKQVVKLYEDLGIDLRFGEIEGKTLSAQQLMLGTDSRAIRFLKDKGVTYNENLGQFVDRTGKALNKAELEDVFKSATASDIKEYFSGESKIDKILAETGADGKSAMSFFEKSGEKYGFKINDDGTIVHHRDKPDITRYDILQIDKGFLLKMHESVVDDKGIKHEGFSLVKDNNQLDIEAIKGLTAEQLKAHGVSEETRDLVVKLHTEKTKGIFGEKEKYVEWGKTKIDGGKVINKASKHLATLTDNDKETMEVMNMIGTAQKTVSRTKDVMKTAKQFGQSAKISVDRLKLKMESKGIKVPESITSKIKKPKPKKPPKKANPNIAKSGDIKKIEKRILKEEKQLKKIELSEKRAKFFKKFDVETRVKEWFAKTKLGKLFAKASHFVKGLAVQAITLFFQIYLILAGFLVVALLVVTVIDNLTALPYKGMMSLVELFSGNQDVAMVQLYNFLDKKEQEWIKVSDSTTTLFENKEDLNYTINYIDYESYINSINGLVLKDTGETNDDGEVIYDLYLDPYATEEENEESVSLRENHLIKVEGFNGNNSYSLVANPSIYTAIDDDYETSAESGHTSNIKDILAMTDVMYGYDMVECSDGQMKSLLNCSPAEINANYYYSEAKAYVSWAFKVCSTIWKRFISGSEDGLELPTMETSAEVSYKTVLNYVTTLFDATHQNQFEISLDSDAKIFHRTFTLNGETIELSNEQASLLKSNNNFQTDNFDIMIGNIGTGNINGNILPYVVTGKDEEGNDIRTSVYSANTNGILKDINQQDVAYANNNWCLWSGMAGDEATFKRITEENMNKDTGSLCWDFVDYDEENGSSKESIEISATGDWCTSEEEAKNSAKNAIEKEINRRLSDESDYQDAYSFSASNDTIFKHSYYESNFENCNINYTTYTKYEKIKTALLPTWYWTGSGTFNQFDYDDLWLQYLDGTKTPQFDYDAVNGTTNYYDAKYPYAPYICKVLKVWYEGDNDYVAYPFFGSFGKDLNGNDWFTVDVKFKDGGVEVTGTLRGESFSKFFSESGKTAKSFGWGDDRVCPDGNSNGGYYLLTNTLKNYNIYQKQYQTIATTGDALFHVFDVYRRDCNGDGYDSEGNTYTESRYLHTYSFYASEVSIQSKGIVYSITNEQLAMSGVYNSDLEYPIALKASSGEKYDLKENGYEDMQGNHVGSDENGEIDYSTAKTAVDTSKGCGLPTVDNPQGSYTGSQGLNIILEGDSWFQANSDTDKNAIQIKTNSDGSNIALYLLKDIFDMDCLLDKASNIFPCADLSNYEGWSADNKTIATLKTSVDWNDVYGFDVPLEVGCSTLSADDIEWLNNALTIQYGEDYTAEKQEVMNLLFEWVGRGHYSEDHNEHDFLSETDSGLISSVLVDGEEQEKAFEVSCTASDSVGFTNFILNAFEKNSSTLLQRSVNTTNEQSLQELSGGYLSLKPCDIIHQLPNLNLDDILNSSEDTISCDLAKSLLKKNMKTSTVNTVANLTKEVSAFYVGCFDKDEIFTEVDEETGEEIQTTEKTLSNGFVITQGVPVTIGMDNLVKKIQDVNTSGCGTIFLRSGEVVSNTDQWDNTTDYYWLINPNSKTYYQSWK
jgi:hypothetical protein